MKYQEVKYGLMNYEVYTHELSGIDNEIIISMDRKGRVADTIVIGRS